MQYDEFALSVSRLNAYIAAMLNRDDMLSDISVTGEISNFKAHSSGHFYFSLKDDASRISCVMFRSSASKLTFLPEDGMKVVVRGRVGVYEKTGVYQIYAENMQKSGIGALYEKYTELLEKLRTQGYFDEAAKKPIPYLPRSIALVTSPTGAAVRDMITVTRRRCPITRIIVCPVSVQGEDAARQIAAMIDYINSVDLAEVIITGRGGGSIEELWAFNEPVVAESIHNSRIPVISAVGHETDFTIADFTADLRAPTPSAAAELAVPDISKVLERLEAYRNGMRDGMDRRLASLKDSIAVQEKKRVFSGQLRSLQDASIALDNLSERLFERMAARLDGNNAALNAAQKLLNSLSADEVLKRGYFIARRAGEVIRDIDIKAQDEIIFEGASAVSEVKVEKVRRKQS